MKFAVFNCIAVVSLLLSHCVGSPPRYTPARNPRDRPVFKRKPTRYNGKGGFNRNQQTPHAASTSSAAYSTNSHQLQVHPPAPEGMETIRKCCDVPISFEKTCRQNAPAQQRYSCPGKLISTEECFRKEVSVTSICYREVPQEVPYECYKATTKQLCWKVPNRKSSLCHRFVVKKVVKTCLKPTTKNYCRIVTEDVPDECYKTESVNMPYTCWETESSTECRPNVGVGLALLGTRKMCKREVTKMDEYKCTRRTVERCTPLPPRSRSCSIEDHDCLKTTMGPVYKTCIRMVPKKVQDCVAGFPTESGSTPVSVPMDGSVFNTVVRTGGSTGQPVPQYPPNIKHWTTVYQPTNVQLVNQPTMTQWATLNQPKNVQPMSQSTMRQWITMNQPATVQPMSQPMMVQHMSQPMMVQPMSQPGHTIDRHAVNVSTSQNLGVNESAINNSGPSATGGVYPRKGCHHCRLFKKALMGRNRRLLETEGGIGIDSRNLVCRMVEKTIMTEELYSCTVERSDATPYKCSVVSPFDCTSEHEGHCVVVMQGKCERPVTVMEEYPCESSNGADNNWNGGVAVNWSHPDHGDNTTKCYTVQKPKEKTFYTQIMQTTTYPYTRAEHKEICDKETRNEESLCSEDVQVEEEYPCENDSSENTCVTVEEYLKDKCVATIMKVEEYSCTKQEETLECRTIQVPEPHTCFRKDTIDVPCYELGSRNECFDLIVTAGFGMNSR